MISATALNASTVPLNKSPQMPLGLDNSRLRVDSQKFLVPSLPVSSRQINPRGEHHNNGHPQQHHHNPHLHYSPQHPHHNHNGGSDKRRERSILNGTAHPIPPPENIRMGSHGLNGLRRSNSPLGGKGSSPNYAHMQSSPRKDAHSPMYGGEVPGFSGSPGSTYSARSSVPIPCSSPSPGASASPKSSNSHSPNSNGVPGSPYSPHLPPGLNPNGSGASELSQLAVAAAAATSGRLYPPGFPPPSAAAAAHFYAAAAAAAGHSLPYPGLFGSHFPHPVAAAANLYTDFHTKLLRNSAAPELRSPSQSPPSRSYHPTASPQQQPGPPHNILQPIGSPQSTSVTSLHTKLIESASAVGDRFHPHHTGHNHIHSSGSNNQQHGSNAAINRFSSSGSNGVSKGGPLGISGGIMGLSISPNSNSPHKGHAGSTATSATPEMSSKSVKLYMEHPGLPGNNSGASQHDRERSKLLAEAELLNGNKANETLLTKQRLLTRSPEDFSMTRNHHQHHYSHHHHQQQHHQQEQSPQKPAKSISFGDMHSGGVHRPNNHSYMNGHTSHHSPSHLPSPHHTPGHHLSNSSSSSSSGSANLSTDCKRATNGNTSHNTGSSSQQHHLFLPPSPKKRSAHWNFAVPHSPIGNGVKTVELLPPPPPPSSDTVSDSPISLSHISPAKYLSQSQQNQKPSNGVGIVGTGSTAAGGTHLHPYQSSTAQPLLVVPSSPLSSSSPSSHGGSSGPSTPKSPAVHFKFFGSANNKENTVTATSGQGRNGRILNSRNDSSSSTSSIELGVINGSVRNRQNNGHYGPWPVEQMPLINAFRKGSMIKLASGDIKAVEDLKENDFEKAVQMMADSVRIVYCHVISIQPSPADNSLCKVTLAMGAAQNQQVVVESSPEQPFFIRGRGWSSSSPKLTEKLLQLPCATLAVGDICITLTRHVKPQSQSTSSGGHHHAGRGSKSKSGTTRPYGTYAKNRNASTSILKSSHQRGNNATRTNGRKQLVSGQQTTTSATVTNHDASNTPGINNNANSILRQGSCKSAASLSAAHPQSDKDERQERLRNENEVSGSPYISPTNRIDQNNVTTSDLVYTRANVTNISSDPKNASMSLPSSSSSVAVSVSETTTKRKSISPCPMGSSPSSGKSKDEDSKSDDASSLRPPSPKKRRWSAPDQIEAESQQNSSTEDTATSQSEDISFSSARQINATSSNDTTTDVLCTENAKDEKVTKSNSPNRIEENHESESKNPTQAKSGCTNDNTSTSIAESRPSSSHASVDKA